MPFNEGQGSEPRETSIKREPGRPTEVELQKHFEDRMTTREISPSMFEETMDEFDDWSRGEGSKELRDQFYPGWKDEDFAELKRRLEEAK